MTTTAPIPPGYHSVTPWVVTADTGALINYLTAAFDAVELARVPSLDGTRIDHAEVRIGDSVVMAFDARPDWPPLPALLRLYVADVEAVHRRAIAAGGTSVTRPTLLFFGDRVGRVRDPLGNLWWIQEHLEDIEPAEMVRRAALPECIAAMDYVQGSLERALRAAPTVPADVDQPLGRAARPANGRGHGASRRPAGGDQATDRPVDGARTSPSSPGSPDRPSSYIGLTSVISPTPASSRAWVNPPAAAAARSRGR
jgi:PhnB protein